MTSSWWWARDRHDAPRCWSPSAVPGALLGFHQHIPGYASSPLVELPELATRLQVGRVLVKDESDRCGLPAFKMLGASWAIARAMSARVDREVVPRSLAAVRSLLDRGGVQARLVTASAGNHGRAVARTARLLGVTARVWIPISTPNQLRRAIQGEGAEIVVHGDYDDAVRLARCAAASDESAVLVQDTTQDGDELTPSWVIEGYATLFHEIHDDLGRHPDVVVVPVGVGSLAQAAVTYTSAALLTVEPVSASCLLASLHSGGRRVIQTSPTALAGLNAGTVSHTAWPLLRDHVAAAVTIDDETALGAAQELHAAGVAAGPCGGAALAGLRRSLTVPAARTVLGADKGSWVVILSTDGAAPHESTERAACCPLTP